MNARVLVVDDEEDILRLMEMYLRSAGYSVDTASSGQEALHKIKAVPVDCVVTDLQLPQMNGIELLKHIKSVNAETPVILVSGQATDMSRGKAQELGAHDFLDKPVKKETLAASVESAIQNVRKQKAAPRILVADDSPEIHRFFNDVLKDENYELVHAEDGQSAADAVMKDNFDMVFMDIHMPEKNGIEAATEIKAKKPGTFVVMMTGEAEEHEVKSALAVGAGYDAMLRKPFHVSTLRLTVKNLFAEKEKYLEKVAEEKRLAERGAGEILKDGLAEEGARAAQVVKSRPFKQMAFVVAISLLMSLVILNLFLPLTEVVSKAPQTITNWMNRMEGYMQRDEQREIEPQK